MNFLKVFWGWENTEVGWACSSPGVATIWSTLMLWCIAASEADRADSLEMSSEAWLHSHYIRTWTDLQCSYLLCVQDHPEVHDLLKEFIEFRKAVIPVAVVYCSKSIWIRINKDKRHLGQSSGETRNRLPVVLFQWSSMWLLLLSC